jgi:hypothetical protein
MPEVKVLTPPDCHFCNKPLQYKFIDRFIQQEGLPKTVEIYQQLVQTYICEYCFLVQLDKQSVSNVIASEYLSSYSPSWLTIMHQYTTSIFNTLKCSSDLFIVELLNQKETAQQKYIRPIQILTKKDVYAFIEMYGKSDHIICHNEMAYTNDINDFVSALKLLLNPEGIISLEFPNVLGLLEEKGILNQVEDVFTYFSFTAIDIIFRTHQLVLYDIEDCQPKGYLRIYAKHLENRSQHISQSIPAFRGRERDKGMSSLSYYLNIKSKMELQEVVQNN